MAAQRMNPRSDATTATMVLVDFESARAYPALRDLMSSIDVAEEVRRPPETGQLLDFPCFAVPAVASGGTR